MSEHLAEILRLEATHWDHEDDIANLLLISARAIEQYRQALEHLGSPNYDARPTAKDARDMAAYARTEAERLADLLDAAVAEAGVA